MSPHAGVPVTEGMLQPFSHGVGFQDFALMTTPAAGANMSFTVTGDRFIRLLSVRATLTTSATVASRFVSLDIVNARAQTMVRNSAGLVVLASTTNQAFEWSGQRTVAEWAANTPVLLPVYPMFLYPGMVVQVTVDSIQAADQISAGSLTFERFDTGDVGYKVGFVGGQRGVLGIDG